MSTGQGVLGNNMFSYCLNNPMNFCDHTGQRADDYPGWVGEELGKLIYKWITGDVHPSQETEKCEREIIQKQIEQIGDCTEEIWDAYMRGYIIQQKVQQQNNVALQEGAKYFIDHPKQAEVVLRDITATSVAVSALVSAALAGNSLVTPIFIVVVAVWDTSWTIGEIIADLQ